MRARYIWDSKVKKWVEPHNVSRETIDKSCSKYSFQIMSKADPFAWNAGLGCRQGEVKENLKRISNEKGVNLVEVGNERPTAEKRDDGYKLDREVVQRIIKDAGSN